MYLEGTSIRDIARESGYTNPALYKHFAGKEELALHLFETCHQRFWTQSRTAITFATPGHTANHLSVIVEDQETTYFLAGATLRAISQFARSHRTIYLPTHDPESASRLASHACVAMESRHD